MSRIRLVLLLFAFIPMTAYAGSETVGERCIIVLKKDVPFVNQVTKQNTIYVIQSAFDLNGSKTGKTVTIPANCILRFEGGSIINGKVSFSNTLLEGVISLDVNCYGTISNNKGYLSWFKEASINSNNLSLLLNNCYETDIDRDITLDAPINIGSNKVEIYSSNNSIIKVNCKPSSFGNTTYYSWLLSTRSPSICIHDINLDFEKKQYPMPKGNNNVYVGDAIRIVAPKICSIYNVHIQNYGKTTGALKYDSFCALAIHPVGYSVIDVHDLLFNNIVVVGDDEGGYTQRGMGECLRVYYNNSNTPITSPVMVYNVTCTDCYSVNTHGKPIGDDFDCIHIDALDSNNRLTLCSISNCYFENINKRAIKAQATNVHIDGVVYKNPSRISGLSVLINLFGEKCVVENIYAFPNTNGSIIDARFSPEVTVSNSIISADPSYSYSSLIGIVDCYSVSNCVIKNVTQAIVGYNNAIGIGNKETKYWGEDNGLFSFAKNVIENCRFENCDFLYVRKNGTQDRLRCRFSNCSFYNCSYLSVGNETELIGCQFVANQETKYEMLTLIGKEYGNENIVNRLRIRNCEFELNNYSKPFIVDRGSKLLRHMVLEIDNTQIKVNGKNVTFVSRNTSRDGESQIVFDDFTIKDSRIINCVFSVLKGWSGSLSVVNSIVPIDKGVITRDVSFYNATLKKGDTQIHLDGVKVQPDYNSLPVNSSVFTGQPAVGTFYWQKGKPTWCNGSNWVDANGIIVQ